MNVDKYSKYKIITFDIFDTLVKRKVTSPDDIFKLVEDRLNNIYGISTGFVEKRMKAKIQCKNKNPYYSIDDIYLSIDFSEEIRQKAEQLEKNIEIEICYPNKKILDFYNEAVRHKKSVILISDMYLDRKTIEVILKKCKIENYDRLYISCEEKAQKTGGSLFRKVLKKEKIASRNVLHIGDSVKGDVISPRLQGIHALHIPTNEIGLDYHSLKTLSSNERKDYLQLQHLIQECVTQIQSEDEIGNVEWNLLGCECLGPLLWGFSNWLADQIRANGIERLFFLSREGAILKKSFEKIYPGVFDCHYLYGSRRSFSVPNFADGEGYEEVVRHLSFPKQISVSDFLFQLGLDENMIHNVIKETHVSAKTIINGWNVITNEMLKELYKIGEQEIKNVQREQKEYLNQYLRQEGFKGKIAIIDVGWSGTMQSALTQFTQGQLVDIHGYYLGVNSKNKLGKNLNAHGYIYEPGRNENYQFYIMGMSGPLEMMMSAQHGTTLSYTNDGTKIIPILADSEYFDEDSGKEGKAILGVQSGTLKFIEYMCKNKEIYNKKINGKVAFNNFFLFGKRPLLKHREMFYGLKEYDSNTELRLLAPKDTCGLVRGFWESSWKIGYMSDRLTLPLPYEKIYALIRRLR